MITTAAVAARADRGDLGPLVARAQRGDPAALAELYRRHVDGVFAYLVVSVGNPHDAEDLTTQTFVRMLESLHRFRLGAAPFAAWLHRIARNLALDHFRASGRSQPYADVPARRGQHAPSAEEVALRWFQLATIIGSIRLLPREQQQVVLLKFVGSFANAEVARLIGKTEGAVKALQHRALDALPGLLIPRAGY